MIIEVVTCPDDAEKKRGDLLENLAKKFLGIQHYEVQTELRRTGMEIDLLCRARANPAKIISVECKAYCETNKIDAAVILKLMGGLTVNGYPEAWLVTTSELTKDAKGLVEKIQQSQNAGSFTCYTPDKLIEAFVSAGLIQASATSVNVLGNLVEDKKCIGDSTLLVTERGYFWATKYEESGRAQGVLLTYAQDSKIVTESELLQFISTTDSSLIDLNFFTVFDKVKNENLKQTGPAIKDVRLNKKYLAQINDIGVKLTHPNKDEVFLDDVFVFPDLQHVREKEAGTKISSSVLEVVPNTASKYLILGEYASGKTSLAVKLQKKFNSSDFLPIYINAEEIKRSDQKSFESLLVKNFKKQYSSDRAFVSVFEKKLNEDEGLIPIIIDDLHHLGIKRHSAKTDFLQTLTERFKNVFIFASTSMEIEALANNETKETFVGFNVFRIKQLGHLLRDELIERWLLVDDVGAISENELLDRKDEITGKINVIVGANFVPTHPLYLLTMLQVIESGSKSRLHGSSCAELYRYLINHALGSVSIKPDDLDFYHTYLAHIGHRFFVEKRNSISEAELVSAYDGYMQKMDIEKAFSIVHETLLKAKILKFDSGLYAFNHNYSYYFFVAKYISENLQNPEVQKELEGLIGKLYSSENANILVFLIHHTKDGALIDKVLNESRKIFSDGVQATLSSQELFHINHLIKEEIKIFVEDKDPNTHRKETLRLKDSEDFSEKEVDAQESASNLFGRINLSFKLMEILGQITSNHYGSLEGQRKIDIVDEVHGLGLRALHALLGDLEKITHIVRKDLEKVVEKDAALGQEDKEKIINRIIFTLTGGVSLYFVKKISDSIASKNLLITSRKLAEKRTTPATSLADMALRLNFPGGLDVKRISVLYEELNNNNLARNILRWLVVEHLYKFQVPFSEKQSVCSRIQLDLNKSKVLQIQHNYSVA